MDWTSVRLTDRGLMLTLRRSWGGSPAGGMDALLGRGARDAGRARRRRQWRHRERGPSGGEGRQAGRGTGTRGPGVHAGQGETGTAGLKWFRLAAALIAAGTSIGSAGAGDFYLRVGAGLDRPAEAAFTDLDCSSVSPIALYGCGRGGDGAPYRSVGDFGTVPVIELGLGYAAAPAVRLEVLAEYRPRFAFDGRANFLETGRRQSVAADLSSLSAMLAAYVDLPGLGVPRLGSLEPFVGAGVGAVHNRIGETRMTFPKTTTIVPGARRTDVAWMVTAGFAVPLNGRMTLDLAWRYTDLGEIRTGRGAGRVVWRDGSREPRALDLAATRAKLRSHGLRLSLRYAF